MQPFVNGIRVHFQATDRPCFVGFQGSREKLIKAEERTGESLYSSGRDTELLGSFPIPFQPFFNGIRVHIQSPSSPCQTGFQESDALQTERHKEAGENQKVGLNAEL